ncbi:hypothetical protein ONZ45_g6450 [Pleurotus djamor]|nr:hypothetical protein ONZ45_g6450 [Pleurotus djamor]
MSSSSHPSLPLGYTVIFCFTILLSVVSLGYGAWKLTWIIRKYLKKRSIEYDGPFMTSRSFASLCQIPESAMTRGRFSTPIPAHHIPSSPILPSNCPPPAYTRSLPSSVDYSEYARPLSSAGLPSYPLPIAINYPPAPTHLDLLLTLPLSEPTTTLSSVQNVEVVECEEVTQSVTPLKEVPADQQLQSAEEGFCCNLDDSDIKALVASGDIVIDKRAKVIRTRKADKENAPVSPPKSRRARC